MGPLGGFDRGASEVDGTVSSLVVLVKPMGCRACEPFRRTKSASCCLFNIYIYI